MGAGPAIVGLETEEEGALKAITIEAPGDESVMRLGEVPDPELKPGTVRIRVAASAVNRADLLQRQGMYPPPPGESPILGLECAGEVVEVAPDVSDWSAGDRAMALLGGGGYAEQVVVAAGSALRIPDNLSYEQAAAVPEVFLTVFLNVFQLAALADGGSALVHGGGSGIGTATIQLVKAVGGTVLVTAGSDAKCRRCVELGADRAINYNDADFAQVVAEHTDGRGVDVVLDSIGGPYLDANLRSLALGGRLVVIGLMGGANSEISLGQLLMRRLQIIGSTLRARPLDEKAQIVAGFARRFGTDLAEGRIAPVVDRVLPLAEASEAHRILKRSEHFGKVVLSVT
jgi:putative PIG3 family NAD(P)H quinone oxidoreductase